MEVRKARPNYFAVYGAVLQEGCGVLMWLEESRTNGRGSGDSQVTEHLQRAVKGLCGLEWAASTAAGTDFQQL